MIGGMACIGFFRKAQALSLPHYFEYGFGLGLKKYSSPTLNTSAMRKEWGESGA